MKQKTGILRKQGNLDTRYVSFVMRNIFCLVPENGIFHYEKPVCELNVKMLIRIYNLLKICYIVKAPKKS